MKYGIVAPPERIARVTSRLLVLIIVWLTVLISDTPSHLRINIVLDIFTVEPPYIPDLETGNLVAFYKSYHSARRYA